MADPFVAEIRIFPFNFAPSGWAFCNGQLLPISQNTALFSLLGTTYGGDGKSNFALPNLQGNSPLAPGQGNGLSLRDLGEVGGEQTLTLLQSEMPAHTHTAVCKKGLGDNYAPGTTFWAQDAGGNLEYAPSGSASSQMNPGAIAPVGGDQPHNNLQPYLVLSFCIALQGVYPPRT
jgi:microcystin-dependent protein